MGFKKTKTGEEADKESGFSGAVKSFNSRVVTSGMRMPSSNRAELSVDSTKDKFTLNGKAMKLLGVIVGDSVSFIDMGTDADNMNERFFIMNNTKGIIPGKPSKIGKGGGFSFAGVHGVMINQDVKCDTCPPQDLVASGKAIATKGEGVKGNSYIMKSTIACELLPADLSEVCIKYGLEVPDTEFPIFAVTNMIVKAHEPAIKG